jgi:hypothetical protein
MTNVHMKRKMGMEAMWQVGGSNRRIMTNYLREGEEEDKEGCMQEEGIIKYAMKQENSKRTKKYRTEEQPGH